MDARERGRERGRIRHISGDDFGAMGHVRTEPFRMPGEATQRPAIRFQHAAEPAADVPGSASQQNQIAGHSSSVSGSDSWRRRARNSGSVSTTSAPEDSACRRMRVEPAPPMMSATDSGRPARVSRMD